ncbi:MAG: hypothetical protein KF729_00350 [Sandaracinaceae bacterium]|nr:hypothetical protein [Sandaracinaceae bacterium]
MTTARTHDARRSTTLGALFALALFGCAAGDECRFGAECPSGVCLPEGRCVAPGEDAGAPPEDAATPLLDAAALDASADDAATPDASLDDAAAPDAGPPACHDGDARLTADELPLPLGVPQRQRVAADVALDTRGTERADGTRLWDFEGPYAGDTDRVVMRTSTSGAWYAGSFPDATYALPLGAGDDLIGVFRADRDALVLLGVVSPEGGLARTELTYAPPAPVWRFPLEVGASWDVTSTVSGVTSGVASVYTERWRVAADARGQLATPAGVRDVWRVDTRITRTVGALVTELRRHSYVEPCAGTVAQVFATGVASEPTRVDELWRIAP